MVTVDVSFNPSRVDRSTMARLWEIGGSELKSLPGLLHRIQTARNNYQASDESKLDAYELRQLHEQGKIPYRFAGVRYEMLPSPHTDSDGGPMQVPPASVKCIIETISKTAVPVVLQIDVPLDFGPWRLAATLGPGFVVTVENKNT